LERLRIVEELPAWNPTLRSSRQAISVPKRHFVDPSLAAAALAIDGTRLAAEPTTLGLWFESLVIRDLRIYAELIEGSVRYYRDNKKLEADAIVELPDGRWGAIEVKLGGLQQSIDAAAKNLLTLTTHVSSDRRAFPAVITNGGAAYRRLDGVDVIPLRMLAP
jgi:predicted AAA+ superfamily ATPase